MNLKKLAIAILAASLTAKIWASCQGHGGPAGCDKASGAVLCTDGSIDKHARCSHTKRKPKEPVVREIKMKPATTNGQIVSPGEKPPPTSIENSK